MSELLCQCTLIFETIKITRKIRREVSPVAALKDQKGGGTYYRLRRSGPRIPDTRNRFLEKAERKDALTLTELVDADIHAIAGLSFGPHCTLGYHLAQNLIRARCLEPYRGRDI